MSQVAPDANPARQQLARLFSPIEKDLARVERRLRRELRSEYSRIDDLVRHAFRMGGKRLRPALVLLAAKAVGEVTRSHIVLSTVVEMIHTATLIHDDVLDEAELRRYEPTANARWDNEVSVLLGDYLFTHSFYLASTLGSTFACRTIGRTTNIVCEGELRQTRASGDLTIGEEEYFRIIEAKTAELCACCCQLGAHYAGASSEVETALADYGRQLGVAFQIADDLLDLVGDEVTVGKSLGTDLEKCKPTLPLIRLLAQAPADSRGEVSALLGDGESSRQALALRLAQSGAIDYARDKALQHAQAARERLDVLPESLARDTLERLTHFVVAREL
jgi:octaprenyl-diphosphate synthase